MEIKEILDRIIGNDGKIPDLKSNHLLLSEAYQRKGLDKKRADYFVKLLIAGWNASSHSAEDLRWVIENGFLPEMLDIGITRENYTEWFSIEKYFRLHPLNNHFAIWVNDKITLKYMLQKPFEIDGKKADVMPEYYLYIENDGHYSYLPDAPASIEKNRDFLLNLLKNKGELAVKPSNGAGGLGFVWMKYKDNNILWNNTTLTESEFNDRISNLTGCIVTEFIHQHPDLDKIYSESAMTLRIIAVRNREDNFTVSDISPIVSYARFGTAKSNTASNLSAGGIGVTLNYDSGRLEKTGYGFPRFYKNFTFEKHPDSGQAFSGFQLPNWDFVKKCVSAISKHLSSLEYFGFDIIITKEGCKLCEINTLPSLDFDQIFAGPLYKNIEATRFFERKEKEKYHEK